MPSCFIVEDCCVLVGCEIEIIFICKCLCKHYALDIQFIFKLFQNNLNIFNHTLLTHHATDAISFLANLVSNWKQFS